DEGEEERFDEEIETDVCHPADELDGNLYTDDEYSSRVFDVVIDGDSHENFITQDIVHQLKLPTEKHPLPYNLGKFNVTECCRISFSIGKYKDQMLFDVVDMDACHIILGKPWVYDLNAIYNIEENTYKFKHNGGRFTLVPLMECNHVSEPKGKNSFIMRYQDFKEEREDEFLVNSTITTTMIQDETPNKISKNLKSLEEVLQALIPDELQPILSPTQDIPLLNFSGHNIEKEHMVLNMENMEVIHGVKKQHVEFNCEGCVRVSTRCSIRSRNELYPNSRFEIFSMNVSVLHSQFDEGYVTGRVTFVDKCRLSNSDGWVGLDKKNNCYVSYFDREWYNAVAIYNGSYIPLGNTSSVHSVPFSSSIEVALMIKATSKERDQSYLIYNGNAGADLTKFWNGDLNTMCGTIKRESKDGRILLDFVAIKDAVDTTMELTFNPVKDARLSGSITASYGNDILGDANFFGQYTALIFNADSTTKYIGCKKPHLLPLHKSAMAVPVNGCLTMHADLVDADTERRIVDKKRKLRKSESSNGVSRWTFGCDKGFFELTVKWVHQARRG
ncbi:arginine--tRNA ligase, chloroplastic/mitochondrial, partial [Tanacetum coccineum]